MRSMMVMALLMAGPVWAQDEVVWRTYDLGEQRIKGESEFELPASTLLGLAMPSKYQSPETWTDDQEATLRPGAASKWIRGFAPDARVVAGENQLLVRAKPADHAVIERALAIMRTPGYLHLDVRELTISKEQFRRDEILRGVKAAMRGRVEPEWWRKVKEAARRTRGGTMRALPGFWTRLEQTRTVPYTSDFDVEIAQAAAVADPIVQQASEGLRVRARGYPLSDGRVLFQLAMSAADLDPEFGRFAMKAAEIPETRKIRDTSYGFVEQARMRGACLATEVLLREGVPVVCLLGSPDRESDAVQLLVLTLRETLPRTPPANMAVLPTGAMTRRKFSRTMRFGVGGALEWGVATSPDEDERMGDLPGYFKVLIEDDDDAWLQTTRVLGNSMLVRAKKEVISGMRSQLAEMEQQLFHSVRCEIRVFRQLAGRQDWIGEAAPVLLAGSRAAFGAYSRRDYVLDYDVEVAQESRIADPVHAHATDGLVGDLAIWRTGRETYRAKLNLRVLVTGETEEFASKTGGVGPVQRIRRSERGSNYFLDLRADRVVELDLGTDPNDPEAKVRLVATVSVSAMPR